MHRATRRRSPLRWLSTGTALLVAIVGIGALGMPSASAHVTVASASAVQGGYGTITFTMPNESAAAQCTKLVVQVPADTPIATVRTQPIPGWTAAITMQTLAKPVTIQGRQVVQAVDTITWTATGPGLGTTEYQTFSISGGPLPMSDTIVFKALQYYSDGSETDWIETPAPGSTEEPDNPAPTLTLTPAPASSGSASDHGSAGATSPAGADASDHSSGGTSGVSIAALIVGIVAVLLAGAALLRRRPTRNG